MVTKMRKSMIIVALAVVICMVAAVLTIDVVRNAYADAAVDISTVSDISLVGGTGDNNDEYTFETTGVTPDVKVGNLQKGVDYKLIYANNSYATDNATVTVKGMGNYTGEKVLTYIIKPNTSLNYTIAWQYNNDGSWEEINNTNAAALFTYGADHSGDVRAMLSIEGHEAYYHEYIYAAGITPSSEVNWNANMHIAFNGTFNGATVDSLVNATSYTATIVGEGSASFGTLSKSRTLSIAKATLNITAADFANFNDGKGNDLWMLSFGADELQYITDKATAAELLDGKGLTYVVNSTAVKGTDSEIGVYARYRNSELTLLLNGNYSVGDVSMSSLLKGISVSYDSNKVTGEANKKVEVVTKATLTFNDNFAVANGATSLEISKTWYIVTTNNALLYADGTEILNNKLGEWEYGESAELLAMRPEHGNAVIVTIAKKGSGDVVDQFAMVYSGDSVNATVKYYAVKTVDGSLAVDSDNEIKKADNYVNCLLSMATGEYTLTAYVPEYSSNPTTPHKHWWSGDEDQTDYGATYYAVTNVYEFAVKQFNFVTDDVLSSKLTLTVINNEVKYNGNDNNTPAITLKHSSGKVLVEGVDYELVSSNVNVGEANLTIKGIGSLSGEYVVENAYKIVKATNEWKEDPSVMNWTYKSYDRQVNLINAVPALLDNADALWFMITTDAAGANVARPSLAKFRLAEDGLISNVAAQDLLELPVGTYYLTVTVDGNDNYEELSKKAVSFQVFQANNYWDEVPGITTWIVGSFTEDNMPTAKAHHGTANIVIYNLEDESIVIYDLANGINKLFDAPVGKYVMKATVANDPAGNYQGLEKTIVFDIFEKAGLPWWAIVVLIVGFLGVAALIIFILLKAGVFKILTRKLTLEIRTKATVEATIAAVRASKVAAAAKESVAKAKARDRAKQLNEARKAHRAKPAEQRAQELALKAQQEVERAERIRAKAEAMHARAASLKASAEDKQAAATTTDNSTEE